MTFTQAELAPYDGVACTLDLINADRGGWGWLAMDNVAIPMTGLVPLPPYESWQQDYPTLVGSLASPTADADRDGKSNLEEFAFGTDPSDGSSGVIEFSLGSVTAAGQRQADLTPQPLGAAGHQADAAHDKRPVAFRFVCI